MKNAIKAFVTFLTKQRVLTTWDYIGECQLRAYKEGMADAKPKRGHKGRFIAK